MPELHELAPGTIVDLRFRDEQAVHAARVVHMLEPGRHWVEVEWLDELANAERISSHDYEVVRVLTEEETA